MNRKIIVNSLWLINVCVPNINKPIPKFPVKERNASTLHTNYLTYDM